jgi:hypothetical protein
MSFYRIQDAARDTRALLDPATWVSKTWNETSRPCTSCNNGYISEWDECPKCDGTATVTEKPRRGVSACRSVRELARYMEQSAGDLRGTVIIELDGDVSDDEDFDADAGALLILPEQIISVTPVADVPEFAEQLAWDQANR